MKMVAGDKMEILGFCLYLPFLLRRWYAYTIITLFITLPFLNLRLYWERAAVRGGSKKASRKHIAEFPACSFGCISFIVCFAEKYGFSHSAYGLLRSLCRVSDCFFGIGAAAPANRGFVDSSLIYSWAV